MFNTMGLNYVCCKQWVKSYETFLNAEDTKDGKRAVERMYKCEEMLSNMYPVLYSELFTAPTNLEMKPAFDFVKNNVVKYLNNIETNKELLKRY